MSHRLTVIEASSWAMANCFEIEKKLCKLKQFWYVDERIARKIQTDKASQEHEVMYPTGHARNVHVYEGIFERVPTSDKFVKLRRALTLPQRREI